MERVLQTDDVDDRQLVARLQQGDEDAFDALVTRHQQRALNVAFQLLRNHEDAAEVAQDSFVSIYRHIGSFRGECAFTTWLHQIVLNLARNKLRWWNRRARQATVSLDAPLETADGMITRDLPGSGLAPDAQVANQEFVRQISAAMDQLPLRFREVLVLRNVEERSYDDIAAALGCSIGTVKSRIARARAALRERMKYQLPT